ncbi:right-handed parallel beta-helix repeat-containing protein [Pontibacter qinzhouensis]|uniref:Right-handed parallel beta-helix repeat-containing protein n=1 Tax=Pontibacter qinzhouensis TaxID=2603253 RepID=A0A5C8K7B8_9BACT|nr:right-handed parallel beta-helix repeat-containing protein [Pontibacter qinzhouensis]TXK46804.1 right-handed parallel beta-helix repeat-containing protein [Pontibacter qinzhouensis]
MQTGKSLLTALLLAATFTFSACEKEDDTLPTAPQVTSELSTLPVQQDEAKVFSVTISAAGKIKEVTATATSGTVTLSEITGIGQNTGSARVNFKAPATVGTSTISVLVTDQQNQQKQVDISVEVSEVPPVIVAAGDVDGTWQSGRTYIVRGNLNVPAGKSLTVEEGVTVIVEGDGSQGGSPEITVRGNFYSYGTAEKPVLFTVPAARRTKENMFTGLWGGILGTMQSQEMVFQHTRIEYAGAPAAEGSPIVTSGELGAGDPRYSIYFTNPNGRFVMQHSTIAYTKDDGMRINQGNFLITNNTFIYTGATGGDALNLKSGSVGDAAFNVFYQSATNGIKCSNSDDRSPQTDVNMYNNTAINCGWRQTKAGRGGSINLEKGGRGKVFNTLVVNCRYGIRFPKAPDNPDITNSTTGHNFYFGNHTTIADEFYPATGSITKGLFETAHDVAGAANENNPQFASLNISNFDNTTATSAENLEVPPANLNFKLQAGSPALGVGKTDFAPKLATIIAGGKTYTAPSPASHAGAFGN